MRPEVIRGDALEILKTLDKETVQCVVTSPPYWGLRDYGVDKQLGLETSPDEYVNNLVEIFKEVKRVLRKDGTVWLNLADTYISKELTGIPWRVAFSLKAEGWNLRSDIIWHKPNTLPESVKDRPSKSHEHVFLLTRSKKYYYDSESIKEPAKYPDGPSSPKNIKAVENVYSANLQKVGANPKRNKRSVWTITNKPYKDAHFATFPEELPEICIKAGSKKGDLILDMFAGSGTTLAVAAKLGRRSIGIELNPEYIKLINKRCGLNNHSLEEYIV